MLVVVGVWVYQVKVEQVGVIGSWCQQIENEVAHSLEKGESLVWSVIQHEAPASNVFIQSVATVRCHKLHVD